MSKSKTTVSVSKNEAVLKVLYTPKNILEVDGGGKAELCLERFYHPGKGKLGLFLVDAKKGRVLEVIEFAEQRRSWLINGSVCSNGRIYLTTPVDTTFLALHHIHKYCAQKAMTWDSICAEENFDGAMQLLNAFVTHEQLSSVADVKVVSRNNDNEVDMIFYKYNIEKTLAWLALKTRRVADALRKMEVYCGQSALSQNYQRSENTPDGSANSDDYLRMANDIIGGYLELALHEKLTQYLEIPADMKTHLEEIKTEAANKRKSLQTKDESESKKIKLDEHVGAMAKLRHSNYPFENQEAVAAKSTPLKERSITSKEKALAKSAKGTKSIASFFKK